MKRSDYNLLKKLAGSWRREARLLREKTRLEAKNAGHSGDEHGTGDEGWRILLEDGATEWALISCASELEKILAKTKLDD